MDAAKMLDDEETTEQDTGGTGQAETDAPDGAAADPVLSEVERQHHALKSDLADAIRRQDFWTKTLNHWQMKEWLDDLVEELERPIIPTVEDIPPKEFASWRDELMAKKFFIDEFRKKAGGDEVSSLRHHLLSYEQNNGLLLPELHEVGSAEVPTPGEVQEELDLDNLEFASVDEKFPDPDESETPEADDLGDLKTTYGDPPAEDAPPSEDIRSIDDLYALALAHIVNNTLTELSFADLQTQLEVDKTDVSRVLDMLEENDVISPFDEMTRKRLVLPAKADA